MPRTQASLPYAHLSPEKSRIRNFCHSPLLCDIKLSIVSRITVDFSTMRLYPAVSVELVILNLAKVEVALPGLVFHHESGRNYIQYYGSRVQAIPLCIKSWDNIRNCLSN